MRRLLLMRHAKTEKESASGKDRDRRLDDRGHRDSAAIGTWLAAHDLLPDRVLVSSAVRARQTWDLLSHDWPKRPAEFRDDLYTADTSDLLSIIREAAGEDPHRLMIVAHNPSLHEIALALTATGPAKAREALHHHMPTGAVAIIDFAVDDWGDVAFRRGRLERFITPRQLREGAGRDMIGE